MLRARIVHACRVRMRLRANFSSISPYLRMCISAQSMLLVRDRLVHFAAMRVCLYLACSELRRSEWWLWHAQRSDHIGQHGARLFYHTGAQFGAFPARRHSGKQTEQCLMLYIIEKECEQRVGFEVWFIRENMLFVVCYH